MGTEMGLGLGTLLWGDHLLLRRRGERTRDINQNQLMQIRYPFLFTALFFIPFTFLLPVAVNNSSFTSAH